MDLVGPKAKHPLSPKVNTVLSAGEVVGEVGESTVLKLGPGLIQNQNTVTTTKAGILRLKPPDTFFIENSQKRV